MSQVTSRIQTLFAPVVHALPTSKAGRVTAVCALAFAALAVWIAMKGPKRCFSFLTTPIETQKPLPAAQAQSFVSCTYSDNDSGVIDFAHANAAGFGFVADVTGHDKPQTQPRVRAFFESFTHAFAEKSKDLLSTQNQLKEFLVKTIYDLDAVILDRVGKPSTLSLALLTTNSLGKKFATIVHVGDSSLFHARGQKLERITPTGKYGPNQLELSSLPHDRALIYTHTLEVQTGDVIYGLTDGITDFLKDADLQPILAGEFSFDKLKTDVKSKIVDPSKADDISLFRLVVS